MCPRKIMDKLLLDHAISCNSHHIKDRPTIEPLTEGQAQHASSFIKLVSLAIFLATLCVVFHNTSLSAFKWMGKEQSKSSALPSAALKQGRKKHSNRNGRLAGILILLQGVVTSAQDNAIGCFMEGTVGGAGSNIATVNNDPVETCRAQCQSLSKPYMSFSCAGQGSGQYCNCLTESQYSSGTARPTYECRGECSSNSGAVCNDRSDDGSRVDTNCPGYLDETGTRVSEFEGYFLGASWRTMIYPIAISTSVRLLNWIDCIFSSSLTSLFPPLPL